MAVAQHFGKAVIKKRKPVANGLCGAAGSKIQSVVVVS